MKGFLTCLAALAWIGVVIYQMSPRRQLPLGCGIHGPEADCICFFKTQASTIELRLAADIAHRGGMGPCPIHGPDCYRALAAKRTGLSMTDEDVGRRAVPNGSH